MRRLAAIVILSTIVLAFGICVATLPLSSTIAMFGVIATAAVLHWLTASPLRVVSTHKD